MWHTGRSKFAIINRLKLYFWTKLYHCIIICKFTWSSRKPVNLSEIRYCVIVFNLRTCAQCRASSDLQNDLQNSIVLIRDSNKYRPPKNYLFTRAWSALDLQRKYYKWRAFEYTSARGTNEKGKMNGDSSREEVLEKIDVKWIPSVVGGLCTALESKVFAQKAISVVLLRADGPKTEGEGGRNTSQDRSTAPLK